MSILSWFLKPKKAMAKEQTKHVKMGKYEISSHAQNRTAEKSRNLKKSDMVINLFGKASKNLNFFWVSYIMYSVLSRRRIHD